MIAGMVDGESIALYREQFGQDFHAFDHAGCHFVIINAPLINSGHLRRPSNVNGSRRTLPPMRELDQLLLFRAETALNICSKLGGTLTYSIGS